MCSLSLHKAIQLSQCSSVLLLRCIQWHPPLWQRDSLERFTTKREVSLKEQIEDGLEKRKCCCHAVKTSGARKVYLYMNRDSVF